MNKGILKKYAVGMLLIPFLVMGCGDSAENPLGPDTGQGNSGNSTLFSSTSLPGASAEAFLTASRFTDLQIEIDYMPGQEPSAEAVSGLQTFLEERLNKSSISITTTEVPSGGGGTYTLSEVRSIEESNRDSYTEASGSTLYAYALILDGKYTEEKVLGIAHYNTSTALFGATVASITGSPPVTPSRNIVEGTIFNHEFAHLLGLVGSGSPQQTDHRTENTPHCSTESCLMEPAIENTGFFENFGGEVPVLDDLCIQDLQANGGK